MNYLALRRQTLARDLKSDKDAPDAVLVAHPAHVPHLSRFTGQHRPCVSTPKPPLLISDDRYETQSREECHDIGKGKELDLHIRPHNKTTIEAAAEGLTKSGAKAVAVEGRLSIGEFEALKALAPKLTFVP